jgi:hypothetical protein
MYGPSKDRLKKSFPTYLKPNFLKINVLFLRMRANGSTTSCSFFLGGGGGKGFHIPIIVGNTGVAHSA